MTDGRWWSGGLPTSAGRPARNWRFLSRSAPDDRNSKAPGRNVPHSWGAVDGTAGARGSHPDAGRTGFAPGLPGQGRPRKSWRRLAPACCLFSVCWCGGAWGQTTSISLSFETGAIVSDSLQVAGATHAPLRVEATLRATATGYAIEGAGLRGKRKTMVGKVLVNTHLTTPSVDASVSLEALVYRPNGSRAEPFSDPLAMPVPYQFLNPAFVDTSLSVKVGRLAVGQAEFDQVRATLQSWHTGSANLNVDAKGRGGTLAAELKASRAAAAISKGSARRRVPRAFDPRPDSCH